MTMDTTKLLVGSIFGFFVVLELVCGRFLQRARTQRRDVIIDVIANVLVPAIILPTVLFASAALTGWLWPESADAFAAWPAWAWFLAFLIGDDLTQYAWHRLSHSSWLYPLHRAHHSAEYMSVRIVYRNNPIYYLLMPGLWISGVLIHLGGLQVYVVYATAKMTIIIGAHSSVPWDAWLLTQRWASPLMWVIERVFSTPATHAAHHGKHADDGVTHYKGNYGNFLFLWDVLFGTAYITRRRPDEFGIENLPPVTVFDELGWPYRRGEATPRTEP